MSITSSYPIKRWDVVMFGSSITKVPVIFVKPDDLFLAFAHKNDYAVLATISGTNTIYDGKTIPGIVDKSSKVPNCKPNFFKKYGLYVVSLHAGWHGYPSPDKLGSVTFSGLKSVTENDIKEVRDILPDIDVAPVENYTVEYEDRQDDNDGKSKNKSGFKCTSILWLSVIFLVILIISMLIK